MADAPLQQLILVHCSSLPTHAALQLLLLLLPDSTAAGSRVQASSAAAQLLQAAACLLLATAAAVAAAQGAQCFKGYADVHVEQKHQMYR
jgi:hypothetical protein